MVNLVMHSDSHWQPLLLPDSSSFHAGWLFIQGIIRSRQGRGETRLRWLCNHGLWHQQIRPVSRRGTLHELVYLPTGARQIALQASSNGADCQFELTRLCMVSRVQSIWRRLRRVWPFYRSLSAQKRQRLGLSWHLWLTDLSQAYQLVGRLRDDRPLHDYEHWLASFDILHPGDHQMITRLLTRWEDLPHICLHLVGAGDEHARGQTLASIQALLYPEDHITLNEHFEAGNKSNRPVGEWQWAIPVGAVLAPAALFWVAHQLRLTPNVKWIYGDDDVLAEDGKRHSPNLKSAWNETLLHSQNYIGWCALWQQQGSGIVPFDWSACHQRWLQLAQLYDAPSIAHIPALLMHLPAICIHQNDYASIQGQESCVPAGVTLEPAAHGICRWRWPLPAQLPLVSVIIPTRNGLAHLRPCIESLVHRTCYPNLEIIVVDNQSDDVETQAYFSHISQIYKVRILPFDQPFNYSAINNVAVNAAKGELICLLNNDTEVITPGWLEEMVSHLLRPGIGAVGAKLYYGDGRVQHGGDAVGPGGCADHLHCGLPSGASGYQRRAVSTQELSAVTAACLLTYRNLYQAVGGLDEINLPVAFNDVDYCLRIREAGWRIVWTPFAELYHHESVSRGKDVSLEQQVRAKRELDYMRTRWKKRLEVDPYYNPNLNYDRPDFSLSRSPRVSLPWMK